MHIGLIGFGSIGQELLARLEGNSEFCISALTRRPVKDVPNSLTQTPSLDAFLAGSPDLVVECAGHGAVRDCAEAVLQSGIPLLIASVGALADADLQARLAQSVQTTGSRLILPSGAIGGLDILRAIAAEGDVNVVYRGIKPPQAWKGSPAEELLDLDAVQTAQSFFAGSGREVALAFPKNANVVAALALSGAGFDTMRATLIADPQAAVNTHWYRVTSPLCSYEMRIENSPSSGNARTSLTTVLSIVEEIYSFAETRPSQA